MYLQAVETAEYKYTQPASRINSPAVIAGARDSNVTNRENILGFQPRILCGSVSYSLFPLFPLFTSAYERAHCAFFT